MKFDNTQTRRQDRLLDMDDAMELLRDGEYGILSMVETRKGATVLRLDIETMSGKTKRV